MRLHRSEEPQAQRMREGWGMDFMHDQTFDGRPFRILTVIDQFSRQFSFAVDRATEFTSKALEEWAYQRVVKLDLTHPGESTENGHIESFDGRLRDECLNNNQFVPLDDARRQVEHWREATAVTARIAR